MSVKIPEMELISYTFKKKKKKEGKKSQQKKCDCFLW